MMPELSRDSAFYLDPKWMEQALRYGGAIGSDARGRLDRHGPIVGWVYGRHLLDKVDL